MRIRYSLIATLVTALAVAPALADTGFIANLSGLNEVGPNASPASGTGFLVLNNAGTLLTYSVTYSGLLAARTAAHFHGPALPGVNAGVVFGIAGSGPAAGNISGTWAIDPTNVARLNSGQLYVNIHTSVFPGGEIRGQVVPDATPSRPSSWGRIKTLYR